MGEHTDKERLDFLEASLQEAVKDALDLTGPPT